MCGRTMASVVAFVWREDKFPSRKYREENLFAETVFDFYIRQITSISNYGFGSDVGQRK